MKVFLVALFAVAFLVATSYGKPSHDHDGGEGHDHDGGEGHDHDGGEGHQGGRPEREVRSFHIVLIS